MLNNKLFKTKCVQCFSQTEQLIGKTVILFEICTETNTVMLNNVLKQLRKKDFQFQCLRWFQVPLEVVIRSKM